MEVSVGLDAGVVDKKSFFQFKDYDGITISPQITNITREDPDSDYVDFSIRNFYEGKCVDKNGNYIPRPNSGYSVELCKKIIIHKLPLVNGFPAEFIIIVNDRRAAFTSKSWSWNMEPVRVNVKMYQSLLDEEWKVERPKSERVMQDFTYHIDIEKNWQDYQDYLVWDFDDENLDWKIVAK